MEIVVSGMLGLYGSGTATSYHKIPFCVSYLMQRGIIHLNPSPAAP
jgi:hypothetical protein